VLLAHQLRDNHFLASLVEQYGAVAVADASMAALDYPAHMVGTFAEAEAILKQLERI
jgi:hypothetical protein